MPNVALVTGAIRGLGFAIARRLAQPRDVRGTSEVEVARRALLEPEAVVLGRLLEELGRVLEDVRPLGAATRRLAGRAQLRVRLVGHGLEGHREVRLVLEVLVLRRRRCPAERDGPEG